MCWPRYHLPERPHSNGCVAPTLHDQKYFYYECSVVLRWARERRGRILSSSWVLVFTPETSCPVKDPALLGILYLSILPIAREKQEKIQVRYNSYHLDLPSLPDVQSHMCRKINNFGGEHLLIQKGTDKDIESSVNKPLSSRVSRDPAIVTMYTLIVHLSFLPSHLLHQNFTNDIRSTFFYLHLALTVRDESQLTKKSNFPLMSDCTLHSELSIVKQRIVP